MDKCTPSTTFLTADKEILSEYLKVGSRVGCVCSVWFFCLQAVFFEPPFDEARGLPQVTKVGQFCLGEQCFHFGIVLGGCRACRAITYLQIQ